MSQSEFVLDAARDVLENAERPELAEAHEGTDGIHSHDMVKRDSTSTGGSSKEASNEPTLVKEPTDRCQACGALLAGPQADAPSAPSAPVAEHPQPEAPKGDQTLQPKRESETERAAWCQRYDDQQQFGPLSVNDPYFRQLLADFENTQRSRRNEADVEVEEVVVERRRKFWSRLHN